MKKYLIIYILIFICLFIYFNEKNKTTLYKKEVESIIKNSYNSAKINADMCVLDAEKYKNIIIQNNLSANSTECQNLSLIYDFLPSHVLLNIYEELVKTSQKYFDIDETVLQTDFWGTPANYIEPYLIKYNVDTSLLKELEKYSEEKLKTVNQYIKETESYCHN